jgi:hypothetical protein
MSNLTNMINRNNIDSVRQQIMYKNSSMPFIPTLTNSSSVVTDMDEFPYKRYFRGIYYLSDPTVAEREAGWRPRYDNCKKSEDEKEDFKIDEKREGFKEDEKVKKTLKRHYPNHCFQVACSTVTPAYPEFEKQYAYKEEAELYSNRACIIQYR